MYKTIALNGDLHKKNITLKNHKIFRTFPLDLKIIRWVLTSNFQLIAAKAAVKRLRETIRSLASIRIDLSLTALN